MKLFVSYSWTNKTHEDWVLTLATELREKGVDVILDKWDLKEGQDSIEFMESMVTNPDINKVLIISDKKYVEKADKRNGGVGTEAQIISPEVYRNTSQEKFVVAVTECDEKDQPYLPTYYKTRKYINFIKDEEYLNSFDQLLRWIYDKPLYVKPSLGSKPDFLDEPNITLGTSFAYKRAINGFKDSKPFAEGSLTEYLSLFSKHLENFRITIKEDIIYDDELFKNIESFVPYREEFIEVTNTVCQYSLNDNSLDKFHSFFESLIPYMYRSEHFISYNDTDSDNFKFIINELFLYFIAVCLKYEKFDFVNKFLNTEFINEGYSYYRVDQMVNYTQFNKHLESLEYRNKRLKLNKLSLHSFLLFERNKHSAIEFKYLIQSDFVLFIRSDIKYDDDFIRWIPSTLLYTEYYRRPLVIFQRAQLKDYFEKMKSIIGINTVSELNTLYERYYNGTKYFPRWQHQSFSPKLLSNIENLATK